MLRSLIILLSLVVWLPYVSADTYSNDMLKTVDKGNGLRGESVSTVAADALGQVWIATDCGVCRYNGQEVKAVELAGTDGAGCYTYDIEINGNEVYAATNMGVFRLSPGSDRFERVYPGISRAETLLCADGVMYVGNRQGLNVCRGGKVTTATVGATPLSIENGVRDICRDEGGALWFISRYALNRYDAATGRVMSINLQKHLPARAALSHVAVSGHRFFIGTKNNGLWIYDRPKDKMTQVSGVGNVITSINKTKYGQICVSADGAGAYLIDEATGRVLERFSSRGNGRHVLPSDAVYYYLRDANGVDWFGFYRYGLAHTYYSGNLFRTYTCGNFTTEGLDVRSVLVNGRQKVIGTSAGLYFVDEGRGLIRYFTPEELGGAHIISTLCYFNGYYYAGSYDGGVRRFSADRLVPEPVPGAPLLEQTTIGSLVVNDKEHRLWIGTSEGLFIIDNDDRIVRYTGNNSRLVNGLISSICFRSDGSGWMCGPNGLCLYTGPMGMLENGSFPEGFFNGASLREIRAGHDSLYYFNSFSAVYYSDWALHRFGRIEFPKVMSPDRCTSFLDDMKGHYWLVTDNGLFCGGYKLGSVMHFGYGDGLRCQLILGRLTAIDGVLWVCTSNGLMSVRLADLGPWLKKARHNILLYDVTVDGASVGYGGEQRLNSGDGLVLTWNVVPVSLSFKPNLVDYSHSGGRLYEYSLDGGATWRAVWGHDGISLSLGFIGSHTLQVRMSGKPSTVRTYSLRVVPSAWAYVELIVLLAAAGMLVWRIQIRRRSLKIAASGLVTEAGADIATESEKSIGVGNSEKTQSANKADEHKYGRVRLDDDECRRIVDRMKAFIEKDKLYTNPDLKMADLAKHLNLSASKLSQVFNLYLKENYYDFINRYRLEEFKRLIADGEYERYTLTALSEKCGFKKSSFFSAFRKFEGMTPAEYLKKHGIKL